jgi:hypothetical protein
MSGDFFTFSEKDMMRGKIVPPAWYRVRVDQITPKLSKNGDSTNYLVEGTILFNADDGTTDLANFPLEWNFNSKAMGFTRGFLEANGVSVEPGVRYSLTDGRFAGQEIDVFVENDLYEGRTVNRVNHKYRAPRQ